MICNTRCREGNKRTYENDLDPSSIHTKPEKKQRDRRQPGKKWPRGATKNPFSFNFISPRYRLFFLDVNNFFSYFFLHGAAHSFAAHHVEQAPLLAHIFDSL